MTIHECDLSGVFVWPWREFRQRMSWFLGVFFKRVERLSETMYQSCEVQLDQVLKELCSSLVLSWIQHGPCLYSSAVVSGGEGFGCNHCSCALSLLSVT